MTLITIISCNRGVDKNHTLLESKKIDSLNQKINKLEFELTQKKEIIYKLKNTKKAKPRIYPKKYGFALVRTKECTAWPPEGGCGKWVYMKYLSDIVTIPQNYSEDYEYQFIDNFIKGMRKSFQYEVLERNLFVYNSYAEASRNKNRLRN